ncbi:hypothetical protein KM043_017531 [Ampulex compressa]|nr:hypothetical protein KM043_017531 [Ampulex compressa]
MVPNKPAFFLLTEANTGNFGDLFAAPAKIHLFYFLVAPPGTLWWPAAVECKQGEWFLCCDLEPRTPGTGPRESAEACNDHSWKDGGPTIIEDLLLCQPSVQLTTRPLQLGPSQLRCTDVDCPTVAEMSANADNLAQSYVGTSDA